MPSSVKVVTMRTSSVLLAMLEVSRMPWPAIPVDAHTPPALRAAFWFRATERKDFVNWFYFPAELAVSDDLDFTISVHVM